MASCSATLMTINYEGGCQAEIEEKKYAIEFSTLAHQESKQFARYKYDYLTKLDWELAAGLLY